MPVVRRGPDNELVLDRVSIENGVYASAAVVDATDVELVGAQTSSSSQAIRLVASTTASFDRLSITSSIALALGMANSRADFRDLFAETPNGLVAGGALGSGIGTA